MEFEQKHLARLERAETRRRRCPKIDLAEVRLPAKHLEPVVIGHCDYEIDAHLVSPLHEAFSFRLLIAISPTA